MIWPIFKKEFLQIARDKRTLAVLVFIPLFLLIMFGYAISLDVKNIPLGVVNLDTGSKSRELLEEFRQNGYFDLRYQPVDINQIDTLMDNNKIQAALVIPRDFTSRILRNEPTEVQLIVDGSNANTGTTILGYMNGIVEQYSAKVLKSAFLLKGGAPVAFPVEVIPRIWFNPDLRSANFLVPSLTALILLSSAVISTSLSVVREKERGTMEQLVVSPIRPFALIVGKTIPYMLISMIDAAGILLAGNVLFGVAIKGSIPMFFLITLIFLLCSLGIGLLLSTVTSSQQEAFMLASTVTLLPSFVLSGFIFPIRNMPVTIQVITYLIPTRYFLVILRSIILKGAGISSYWQQVVGLVVLAGATISASSIRIMGRKR
jgi:ABC-2 type transport system permease protein